MTKISKDCLDNHRQREQKEERKEIFFYADFKIEKQRWEDKFFVPKTTPKKKKVNLGNTQGYSNG